MSRRKADRPGGRGRVAVLLVLCCTVFVLFFARLAWMQFAMADHYAEKAAEASSASYTVEQHAARGMITDRNGTVLARDTTVYDVYLRVPAPPGTDLTETVQRMQALTGGKDVETQLAAFCSAVSAGELLVMEAVDSETMTALYQSGLVQSGAIRLSARGERSWPEGTLLPHALGFTGPITAEEWPAAQAKGLAMDSIVGQSGLEEAYDDLLRGQDGQLLINTGLDGAVRATIQQRTRHAGRHAGADAGRLPPGYAAAGAAPAHRDATIHRHGRGRAGVPCRCRRGGGCEDRRHSGRRQLAGLRSEPLPQ